MSLNDLAQAIHANAVSKGFWVADRNMGEMLMLATSELAEALEEHRDGMPNVYVPIHQQGCLGSGDGLPDTRTAEERDALCGAVSPECKPEGVAVEVADCIIRCLDILHSLGVDIDEVVARKMAYNATRPHKHGKAY